MPVETTESCDLLIAWGISGAPLNGPWVPSPGPNFTIRAYEYGVLALEDATAGIPGLYIGAMKRPGIPALEDATAGIPGLYIGAMKWNVYAHWDLGLAAFKM